MRLDSSVEVIKGVGPKTAQQLATVKIQTVGDLIYHLPFRHEDYSRVSSINEVSPGKVTVKARVESVEVRRVRRAMTVTSATLSDKSGKLKAVWFNQPYRATQLKTGGEFYFSGNFEFRYNRFQLTQPSVDKVSEVPEQLGRLLPIYRQPKGLKSQLFRKVIRELKPLLAVLPETLPDWLVDEHQLISHAEALRIMHFPSDTAEIAKARQRLAFEELLPLTLASQINRRANAALESYQVPFRQAQIKKLIASLSFDLTDDQRRAAWDIIQDMTLKTPMNRMLQGDVGSGKTVVAAVATYSAALAGYQTALMAPTEVLARQHAETLSKLLTPLGVSVGLLTGSVTARSRALLYQQIASGSLALIIGTHALIQEQVVYRQLGLVVIDEQHRFGVAQRQALLTKAEKAPHVLAMTATPIPRSLQLTVFGELDISLIKQRPSDRLPIKTKIVSPVANQQTYQKIDQELKSGRQAYVICSLIEDSSLNDKKSVQAVYRRLKNSILGGYSIGLLHGRLKSTEKEKVMQDFKDHKYDILVSTTVVEVGVDVANASVIMIEDADQFGLAQLHQLRGRVGRSQYQSYCYLVMSDMKKPSQRLRELEKSNDGFYLAEVDLGLRGPGEIYGRAQHGNLNLQIATLDDTRLVQAANQAAQQVVRRQTDLATYPRLQQATEYYQRLTMLN